MWSEWLVRTLKPRGDKVEARPRKPVSAELPDLEGDGMHPGADDFRSALSKAEAPAE